MDGASGVEITASASTSHISEILRLRFSGMSRSERQISASGWMPMLRSAATECWVGLVFSSPDGARYGTSDTCRKKHVLPADVVAHLPGRLQERQRLDIADGAADLGDHDVGTDRPQCRRLRLGHRPDPVLDLVGDVRDDLDGVAEIFPAALPGDHPGVHLAGGHVGLGGQVPVQEPLVVPDVQVGLRAVLGDEHLAVLERVHRAGVDVDVRVELLHGDPQAARGEQAARGWRRSTPCPARRRRRR